MWAKFSVRVWANVIVGWFPPFDRHLSRGKSMSSPGWVEPVSCAMGSSISSARGSWMHHTARAADARAPTPTGVVRIVPGLLLGRRLPGLRRRFTRGAGGPGVSNVSGTCSRTVHATAARAGWRSCVRSHLRVLSSRPFARARYERAPPNLAFGSGAFDCTNSSNLLPSPIVVPHPGG